MSAFSPQNSEISTPDIVSTFMVLGASMRSVIPRIMKWIQLLYWPKIWFKKMRFWQNHRLPDSSHLWRSPQMWRLSQIGCMTGQTPQVPGSIAWYCGITHYLRKIRSYNLRRSLFSENIFVEKIPKSPQVWRLSKAVQWSTQHRQIPPNGGITCY